MGEGHKKIYLKGESVIWEVKRPQTLHRCDLQRVHNPKKNSPLPTKAQSIRQFCFLRERLKSNAGKMSDLIFWVYLRQGYPI